MSRKRRVFSPAFKAKVALAAARGEETTAQLAAKFVVHSSQVTAWKKQLLSGVAETLSYMHFPREHWTRICTNNPLERIMREIRRRRRVVGVSPDGKSALMLMAGSLRHLPGGRWGHTAHKKTRLRAANSKPGFSISIRFVCFMT